MRELICNIKRGILLVVPAAAVTAAVILIIGPISAIGMIALLGLIAYSFRDIKALFYVLFLWSLMSGFLMNATVLGKLNAATYIDEALVIIIAFNFLSRSGIKNYARGLSNIILAMALFFLFAAISAFLNRSSLLAFVNFSSTYLKVFIIFVCAAGLLDVDEIKRLIIFILYSQAMLFMVANLQFFSFGRMHILVGREISLWQDAATALFGKFGAHVLGHFSMITLIISSSLWLFTAAKRWLFLSLLSLYNFILSFTEQDYIFLAFFCVMLAGAYLRLCNVRHSKNIVVIFGLMFMAFILFFSLFSDTGPVQRYMMYFRDHSMLESSGKMQSLVLMKKILFLDPKNILLGVGPGSFSSGIAEKLGGEYYKQYIGFRVTDIVSTADFWWSSFSSLVTETGVIGYCLYFSMILIVFFRAFGVYRSASGIVTDFDRGMAFALYNILLFLLYISLLSNALEWISLVFPVANVSAYVWRILPAPSVKKGLEGI